MKQKNQDQTKIKNKSRNKVRNKEMFLILLIHKVKMKTQFQNITKLQCQELKR